MKQQLNVAWAFNVCKEPGNGLDQEVTLKWTRILSGILDGVL